MKKKVNVVWVLTIVVAAVFIGMIITSIVENVQHHRKMGSSKLTMKIHENDSILFNDTLLSKIRHPFGSESKIGRITIYSLKGRNQLVVLSEGLPDHVDFLKDFKLVATTQPIDEEGHHTTGFLGGKFILNPSDLTSRFGYCHYRKGAPFQELLRTRDTLFLRGNPGFLTFSNQRNMSVQPINFHFFNKKVFAEIALFNNHEGTLMVLFLSEKPSKEFRLRNFFRR